ncbi:hypothetical protein vBPaerPsIn_102 [Pseudomonas phage vB_Paer_PsIn]|uniref:Uncharacterized protein n=2 Tax=Pakpunavirus TaxID=1921407 RepID=A0AAE9GP05_9CAUD|nr:hypothetical protein QE347_gp103 [Pseudomonas phage vB_Paer_Ps12]YP_010765398.1 hypothetical protein QE348_gp102 [Pseudomonas phage vB_Paer_PsIn]UOL47559.1 hypothetical protein vBPaerPs12_103 [Pseudomonas phage vB_Paer_Ps12]UOL47747.1 hypothetical protein vBPaerPs25_103 [Pseudomonas phage vB_Paer_Ps25]UOL48130.1 hypothetical protein vBPaerPsIn_102 [Pseudomonas phage vB_Paer_PsIn]
MLTAWAIPVEWPSSKGKHPEQSQRIHRYESAL